MDKALTMPDGMLQTPHERDHFMGPLTKQRLYLLDNGHVASVVSECEVSGKVKTTWELALMTTGFPAKALLTLPLRQVMNTEYPISGLSVADVNLLLEQIAKLPGIK